MDFGLKPVFLELPNSSGLGTMGSRQMTPQGTFAELLVQAQQAGVGTGLDGEKLEDEKLLAACRELEAVFLNLLAKEMRKTVPEGGLLGTSRAQEFFTGMLDEALTEEASKSGTAGLADLLFLQLKATQDEEG